jgi:hypothetical protein
VLHKHRLSSAKSANADATPSPGRCAAHPAQAEHRYPRRASAAATHGGCGRARLHLPSTLQKVEAGNANVSIGIYAAVLQALGLLDGLGEIADIAGDSVGQALASVELPKRVCLKRTSGPTDHG